MSEIEKRVRKQASSAVVALNPGFFGVPNDYEGPRPELVLSDPGAIAPHFMRESTDESKLNKTEKAYLSVLRAKGYAFLGIQNVTLKLADDCRLTCDFVYLDNGRLIFVDVKGFQREDALIKIKMASRLFLWANFQIVKKTKEGWDVKEVKP